MKQLLITFLLVLVLSLVSCVDVNASATASFDISQIQGLGSVKRCKNTAGLDQCLIDLCTQYSSIITDASTVTDKVNFAKVLACTSVKFSAKMYGTTFSAFTTAELSDCANGTAAYTAFITVYTGATCTTYFTSKYNQEKNKINGQVSINLTIAPGYDKDKCQTQIADAKKSLTAVQAALVVILEACISAKVTIDTSFAGYKESVIKDCLKSEAKFFASAYLEGYCANITPVTGDANIKALTFSELYAQTKNLNNDDSKKSALVSISTKISANDDNPCDTTEGVQKLLKLVDEIGTNQTELVTLFANLEIKLKAKISTDTTGAYCQTVAQYLMVAEKLQISNGQGQTGDFKVKVDSATNLYISCANFLTGSESLQLKNSKLTMKTFDPDSASSVDLTSGSNSITINSTVLGQLKIKAGLTNNDEIVATVKTQVKASAGLSASLTNNITASEIVTAEFKKKSGNTVTDISVGSLSDNATFSVKFSTSVETGSNKCVRLENNAWVDSGSFEATSTTKSSVCLMNHASEFTIVSSTSATIDTKGNFGSKIQMSLLAIILLVLLL